MKTMLLDLTSWDLLTDASGNWAVAAEPYALAQDVASEIKLFRGEAYYDQARGVPYLQRILGKSPTIAQFQEELQLAAALVPGVVNPVCVVSSFQNREVRGSVTFRDTDGNTGSVAIGT